MARPLRIEYSGAFYLVTSTGNAGNDIFRDDEDRRLFMVTLSEVVLNYHWTCHAYCLMTNQYHLFVETPKANLSRGMRHLNGVYTQRYNSRHGLCGHLFQGRFKGVIVDEKEFFLEVCRHVVLYPVRAGLAATPEEWSWSSYRGTAGLESPPYFLTTAGIVRKFNNNGEFQARYREFVSAGTDAPELGTLIKGQVYLGSEEFISHIQELLTEEAGDGEIPRKQLQVNRIPLDELIPPAGRNEQDRGMYTSHIHHGYTLKEIGSHLGIHYSTVSRRLKSVADGKAAV